MITFIISILLLAVSIVYGQYNVGQYAPKHNNYEPAHYMFSYGVADPKTGDQKHHWEKRDGHNVRGEYGLMDPDGFARIVQYTSDPHNGFQATVKRIAVSKEQSQGKELYPESDHQQLYDNIRYGVTINHDIKEPETHQRYQRQDNIARSNKKVKKSNDAANTFEYSKLASLVGEGHNTQYVPSPISSGEYDQVQPKVVQYQQPAQYVQPKVFHPQNIDHYMHNQHLYVQGIPNIQNIPYPNNQHENIPYTTQHEQQHYQIPQQNNKLPIIVQVQNVPQYNQDVHQNVPQYNQDFHQYDISNSQPQYQQVSVEDEQQSKLIPVQNFAAQYNQDVRNIKVPNTYYQQQNIENDQYPHQKTHLRNVYQNYDEYRQEPKNINYPVYVLPNSYINRWKSEFYKHTNYKPSQSANSRQSLSNQKDLPVILVNGRGKIGLPFYPSVPLYKYPIEKNKQYNYEGIPLINTTNEEYSNLGVYNIDPNAQAERRNSYVTDQFYGLGNSVPVEAFIPNQQQISNRVNSVYGATRETIWQAGDPTADYEPEILVRQINETCAYFRFNETTPGTEDGTVYNIWNAGDYSAQREEEELIRSTNVTCANFTQDLSNNFTNGYTLAQYCSQCLQIIDGSDENVDYAQNGDQNNPNYQNNAYNQPQNIAYEQNQNIPYTENQNIPYTQNQNYDFNQRPPINAFFQQQQQQQNNNRNFILANPLPIPLPDLQQQYNNRQTIYQNNPVRRGVKA